MNLLNLEDDKIKSVKVKGHDFKIRWMSPLDRVRITQKRIGLQNGNPVESLTQDDFAFYENIATVDTCIEEHPKQFPSHESCVNWPDIEMINKLAQEIRTHTSSLEEKLKKNRPIEGSD